MLIIDVIERYTVDVKSEQNTIVDCDYIMRIKYDRL